MNAARETLDRFFRLLGLSGDETDLYLILSSGGARTALELSRASGLPRTRVYRLLADLEAKGVITTVVDEHRNLFRSVPVTELSPLVTAKQNETADLLRLYPLVRESVAAFADESHGETSVRYYRGRQGIRQMVWHTLRAEREIVGYSYRMLEEYLDPDFLADWRDAFLRKKLSVRDILGDAYLDSVKKVCRNRRIAPLPGSSRYLPQAKLAINLQMDIYNDVVAQYTWHEGEVFGVEIYNAASAAFHRQLFEVVWASAVPIPDMATHPPRSRKPDLSHKKRPVGKKELRKT